MISIDSTPQAEETPAQKAARNVVRAFKQARDSVRFANKDGAQHLWNTRVPTDATKPPHPVHNPMVTLPAKLVLDAMAPESQRRIIAGSLTQRIADAVEAGCAAQDNQLQVALSAFVASSPVPDDKDLHMYDESGNEIDMTAAVTAVIAQLISIQSLDVIDRPQE